MDKGSPNLLAYNWGAHILVAYIREEKQFNLQSVKIYFSFFFPDFGKKPAATNGKNNVYLIKK